MTTTPTTLPTTGRLVLLNGYAAKRCARETHNRFDATVVEPKVPLDPGLERLFADGRAFEAAVVGTLLDRCAGAVDLNHLDEDKAAHIAATLTALADGAPLVVGGRLPDDLPGGRTGKPDLLVRAERRDDGRWGYHPADVKAHLTTERSDDAVVVSTVDAPARNGASLVPEVGLRDRPDDDLQLAHYWRMLEACGHEAAAPWAAIVGTDGTPGLGAWLPVAHALVWRRLDVPEYRTFSRTAAKGVATRTALERYDHEHTFRLQVARVAGQRTGTATDPLPLVDPVGRAECGSCVWETVCVDTLPVDDLSRTLRGHLSLREYAALRGAGVTTLADLADTPDVEALLGGTYPRETADVPRRRSRLVGAQLRARLLRDGVQVRSSGTQVEVPHADVEYDVDCEFGRTGHVYLWGVLRTEGSESRYLPFLDLAAGDVTDPGAADVTEAALTQQFLTWLAEQIAVDTAAGRTTAVFHWNHTERTAVKRVVAAQPDDAHLPGEWVDLLPFARTAVHSAGTHGLKFLATHGAGFTWRDSDPGGWESQLWLAAAVAGDKASCTRLLEYNEDDVRAALATRRWLRAL